MSETESVKRKPGRASMSFGTVEVEWLWRVTYAVMTADREKQEMLRRDPTGQKVLAKVLKMKRVAAGPEKEVT